MSQWNQDIKDIKDIKPVPNKVSNDEATIEIPPRYETLGRARPTNANPGIMRNGTVQSFMSNSMYEANPNNNHPYPVNNNQSYPPLNSGVAMSTIQRQQSKSSYSSPIINPNYRQPCNTLQFQNSRMSPPSSSVRMSYMSTVSSPGFGPQQNQPNFPNARQSLSQHQASPPVNPTRYQMLRNRNAPTMYSSPNSIPLANLQQQQQQQQQNNHYPIIPSRDVSRGNSSSGGFSRHQPASSISSISSVRTDISSVSLPISLQQPSRNDPFNSVNSHEIDSLLNRKPLNNKGNDEAVAVGTTTISNNASPINVNTKNLTNRKMSDSPPSSATMVSQGGHSRSKSSSPPSNHLNTFTPFSPTLSSSTTNSSTTLPMVNINITKSASQPSLFKPSNSSSSEAGPPIIFPERGVSSHSSSQNSPVNGQSSNKSLTSGSSGSSNSDNNLISNASNSNPNLYSLIHDTTNNGLKANKKSSSATSLNKDMAKNNFVGSFSPQINGPSKSYPLLNKTSSSPMFSKRNQSVNTPPLTPLYISRSPSQSSTYSANSTMSNSPIFPPTMDPNGGNSNNSPLQEKPMMATAKSDEIVIPPRKNASRNISYYSNVSNNSTFVNNSFGHDNTTTEIALSRELTLMNDNTLANSSYGSYNTNHSLFNNRNPSSMDSNKSGSQNDNIPIVLPVRTKASLNPNLKSQDNLVDKVMITLDSSKTVSPINNNKESTESIPSGALTPNTAGSSNMALSSMTSHITASQSETIYLEGETREKFPLVNHSPLLSEIAEKFRNSITLIKQTKDSIEYSDCFSGAMAVSIISTILGTKDRKLALIVGRSLESQLLFHDVVYTNKLLDSKDNIYQMQGRTVTYDNNSKIDFSTILYDYIDSPDLLENNENITNLGMKESAIVSKQNNILFNSQISSPTGVFVAIAQCYSPTCCDDSPCYSWSCPRRKTIEVVMQKKKVTKDNDNISVKVESSNESAWSTTIGKSMLDKVDDHERKRQEIIYEFIQSEKEYVDDLLSVRNLIMKPLRAGFIPKIGSQFVNCVFGNIEQIITCNEPFSDFLQQLQSKEAIIDISMFGEIVKDAAKGFVCYIRYGEIQPLAKQILQIHKSNNYMFESFLKDMQAKKEFRRLPLESFLARPTTRLGRYPILIKDILKHTQVPQEQLALKNAMNIIENILKNVNEKAGKTTNKLKLDQWTSLLDQSTIEKREEVISLQLHSPNREFIREGTLFMKKENNTLQEVNVVFLNNAFVITRKKVNSIEIIRKPIPIQLIKIVNDELTETHTVTGTNNEPKIYSFTIIHVGFKQYTLCSKIYSEQKSWVEAIEEKIKLCSAPVIDTINIGQYVLKINSVAIIKDDIMIFASDNGLYTNIGNTLTLILPLPKITQIDAMPDVGLLFVLIDREIIPYSIDSLLKGDLVSNFKKPRRLCSGISFMVVGYCDGHCLLCAVKSANTNTTIKTYEPNQRLLLAIKKNSINKTVSTIDILSPFKQFYIPAEAKSIQFLKRALCIGCVRGFEVVDINTLTTQSLFDAHEPSYEKIIKADFKPVKVIKTNKSDFLVCYNKIGFFLDKNGNRSRPNICFNWINQPVSFAYIPPYILAFGGDYIEVWIETNSFEVKQILYGHSFRQIRNSYNDGVYIVSGNETQVISRVILSRKR